MFNKIIEVTGKGELLWYPAFGNFLAYRDGLKFKLTKTSLEVNDDVWFGDFVQELYDLVKFGMGELNFVQRDKIMDVIEGW